MYVLTFLRVFIKWFYSCTNQLLFLLLFHQNGFVRYNKSNIPCQCGYPDGMSPPGKMVFPRAPPSGKPSSLGETFHQDTHTGMAYLYIKAAGHDIMYIAFSDHYTLVTVREQEYCRMPCKIQHFSSDISVQVKNLELEILVMSLFLSCLRQS